MTMTYEEFIQAKQYSYKNSGFEVDEKDLNKNLFPFQKAIVKWAIAKGRCALFLDTGLGKTICQLEYANQICKHTGGKALILAPLAVSVQTRGEGKKFGIEVNICRTQADVKDGINITNYEMLSHFNPDEFICIILDESSILKSFMGKTKRYLCDVLQKVPYRMACTATPAPNDTMELLNHAEFLGIMRSNECLAIWFIADQSQMGNYRLKRHAIADFYEWVSSWAICINKPSDMGYDDTGYNLPKLSQIDVFCDKDFFGSGTYDKPSATNYHKLKRVTLESRCKETARICNESDEQFVVWCELNDEGKRLKELIHDSVEISGSDSIDKKEKAVEDFKSGRVKVLISKPLIFGYGLNFQNCHNTIFCGLSYSYENYYQAVRRFYRFGQTKPVNVYRVLSIKEKYMLNTLNIKADNRDDMNNNMIKYMRGYQTKGNNRMFIHTLDNNIIVPEWLKEEI